MLQPIAPDVWHLPAPALLRFPGGLRMPLASTVIRLPDRSLLLYSPVELDDARVAALAELGEVAHIVAPNLLHHLWAPAAAARFPRATVHAAPGLRAKVAALANARELDTGDAAWRGVVDCAVIAGAPKINETVLFHRPSGTLLVADLVFNITEHASRMTTLTLKMMGVAGKQVAQSRVWKLAVKDRPATRSSLDAVLAWPIERVAPAHGAPAAIACRDLAGRVTRAYGGTSPVAT
jgi:hypothetical protein